MAARPVPLAVDPLLPLREGRRCAGTLDSVCVAYVNHSASDFALMHVSCELYGDDFPPEILSAEFQTVARQETSGTWEADRGAWIAPVVVPNSSVQLGAAPPRTPASSFWRSLHGVNESVRDRDGIIRRVVPAPPRFHVPRLSPLLKGWSFNGLSCPTALLCVAVGEGRGSNQATSVYCCLCHVVGWKGGLFGVLHGVMFGPKVATSSYPSAVSCPEPLRRVPTLGLPSVRSRAKLHPYSRVNSRRHE